MRKSLRGEYKKIFLVHLCVCGSVLGQMRCLYVACRFHSLRLETNRQSSCQVVEMKTLMNGQNENSLSEQSARFNVFAAQQRLKVVVASYLSSAS
jgi:hypothetical protein